MKDFNGKIAVVTGAASGIGLGAARAFARAGMAVAMLDLRTAPLVKAAESVATLGVRVLPLTVDVSSKDEIDRAAERIDEAFGRIDVVVNNAGVVLRGLKMAEIGDDAWSWLLGVNLYGVIHGIQAFVPRIQAHGEGGHVVNTASMAGLHVGSRGTGAYAASKFAVVALSEALSGDLAGTGIGVSVLAPAAVASEIYTSSAGHRGTLGGPNPYAETPAEIAAGMDPDEVGRRVLAGIREEQFFIFTHPETRAWVETRHARIMAGYDAAERYRDATP